MAAPRAYLPDLLVTGGEVHAGAALSVADGVVVAVGEPVPGFERVRLAGRAVTPGLVSAHGHSFQRAIRGRTQFRAPGRSDFWSWREAMYRVAGRIGPDELHAVALLAFHEAARAGVTTVGEFHYLSRDPAGRPYAEPDLLARTVVRAAREVGLRVVLLRAAYARGGAGVEPGPAQRRFLDDSPDDVLASATRLATAARDDRAVSVGLAPHSVRACPADWIARLAGEARSRGWPLHLHVSEQPAEVEQCRAEHGLTPVALLDRLGALGPGSTAVHAIHLTPDDVATLGRTRTGVCACPTTERDLGDGVVPADALLRAGAGMALGSDSYVETDLLAEARSLEGNLRLLRGERGVLDPGDGRPDGLAARLLGFATGGGMAALGLPGGRLAPGDPADFVSWDLDDPSLAGSSSGNLLSTLVFSGSRAAVRDVVVAGEPVREDGAPARGRPEGAGVAEGFRRVMRVLEGG